MIDDTLSVLSSGIDWCTLTAKWDGKGERLREKAHRIIEYAMRVGNEKKDWRASGYKGYRAGGAAFGVRHDGCILVLSSATASALAVFSIPDADNVSRIDLQVTCHDKSHQAERAHLGYYSLMSAPRKAGRPPSASLRLNSNGGQTLYVGSRASARVGRLYDKGVEQKTAPPGAYWRYEVEYKGDEAARLAQAAIERQLDDAIIAALVMDYFAQRGIPAPACHEDISIILDGHRATLEFDGLSDADKTLRWLNDCVRQSVARLISSGRVADVVRALGMDGEEGLAPSPLPPNSSEED